MELLDRATFAARVLSTDLRLHGRRFVTIEFLLAGLLAVAIGTAVGLSAVVRGSAGIGAVAGVIFFAGVAVNSAAVVGWVGRHPEGFTPEQASLPDLAIFCAATLIPRVLALSLRS